MDYTLEEIDARSILEEEHSFVETSVDFPVPSLPFLQVEGIGRGAGSDTAVVSKPKRRIKVEICPCAHQVSVIYGRRDRKSVV